MMNDWQENLLKLGHAIVRRARFSNAMGLPLVFVIFVFFGCLGGYLVTKETWLLVFMGFVIVFFVTCFGWFMIKNPNMLRTEEHEEKMLQISAGMGQKGEELSETTIDELPDISSDEAKKLNMVNKQEEYHE